MPRLGTEDGDADRLPEGREPEIDTMVRRRRRSGTTPLALWTDMMLAGAATAVTLSVRLPQLMTGTMTRAESARMVGEKLAAASEGLVAASAAGLRVAARRGPAATPRQMLDDALEVSAAALRPAQRRVAANAKRLTRPDGPR
jgi:hypothetical protein